MMYKTSMPISMTTVNERTLPIYLEQFRKCRAERVFICGIDNVYTPNSLLKTDPESIRRAIAYFQENGLEVGIWISAFGHGTPLFAEQNDIGSYTSIEGIHGDRAEHALCPLDPQFLHDYKEAVKLIAALNPDVIMLDDDFRINGRVRHYHFGCFCKYHLAKYYERIGETVPREQLEELILCGGENKYRTAYLDLMGETLLNFARELRSAVDEINPNIRMGACSTFESWDLCGTDLVAIAKAFAGNTAPFSRISGAPYWDDNIIPTIEFARQQYAWGKDSGVEIFAEGDTYPRPRYNVPSKIVELFDMALLADGTGDGILYYAFDYSYPPEYEPGYAKRFARNQALRDEIKALFAGKHPVGVRVCASPKKFRQWELPKKLPENLFTDLHRAVFSPSRYLISQNSISTSYEASGYPALVLGVDAKDVTLDDLCHGAIIDVEAANILQKKGIDVGLLSEKKQRFAAEYYPEADFTNGCLSNVSARLITCREEATVVSRFLPDNSPASYLYENADGLRFFVLAFDHYASHENTLSTSKANNPNVNYFNNYCRQADLIRAIEWLGKKPLPAICPKNPGLYLLASKNEGGDMAVALCNVSLDDVIETAVKLDKPYSSIRFVNCTGTLNGDTVTLSDLPPYGFAAFEVTGPNEI